MQTAEVRLVREAERLAITGIPRATAWALIREGKFPKPVPIGPQARAWVHSELVEWVKARIAERDGYAPREAEMRRRRLVGVEKHRQERGAA